MTRIVLCLVWLAAVVVQAAEPAPGASTFGEHDYIEYVAGDLPFILSAPHGGRLVPDEIPDRTRGVRDSDVNTEELARAVAEAVHERTGHHAHLIISHLQRTKLDPNREIVEAAAGNPLAERAWEEYHAFIDRARAAAVAKFGSAFFIDLHGHGHPTQRLELGYLHSTDDLAQDEAALNAPEFVAAGSLRLAAARWPGPYVELLRGSVSLGALFEAEGFRATPSPSAPEPVVPYFRGGYTVGRHCKGEDRLTGLQIECNRIGVRDTPEHRRAFAHALVAVLKKFLPERLGLPFGSEKAPVAAAPAVPERAAQ